MSLPILPREKFALSRWSSVMKLVMAFFGYKNSFSDGNRDTGSIPVRRHFVFLVKFFGLGWLLLISWIKNIKTRKNK